MTGQSSLNRVVTAWPTAMGCSHPPPQELNDYYVPRIRQELAKPRAEMRNRAMRRLCFPIPILALLACVVEAGAATPCDLVMERARDMYVETATALDAWERKDAVAVCRYKDMAGPAIDSHRREVAACIRDIHHFAPRSAEARQAVERLRTNLHGFLATWQWLEPLIAQVACPVP